jgi:hypothetical protein
VSDWHSSAPKPIFKMSTTIIPPIRYQDAEYQNAHNDLYLGIPIKAPEQILPSGVSGIDFQQAIEAFVKTLGKDSVFTGEALRDYVDPYEIPQPGVQRKIPSAAVTYMILATWESILSCSCDT